MSNSNDAQQICDLPTFGGEQRERRDQESEQSRASEDNGRRERDEARTTGSDESSRSGGIGRFLGSCSAAIDSLVGSGLEMGVVRGRSVCATMSKRTKEEYRSLAMELVAHRSSWHSSDRRQ